MLCFSIPPTGLGKSLFIVPVVTKVLPFCPLTVSVWSGRTCRPLEVCTTHSCQTEAGFISPSTAALLSCHGINALSLHSQGVHPMVPPQICLFWVVCHPSRTYLPKGLWAEATNRPFPLSPPPNHSPFTSYLWPMAPPYPILAGYRLVVLGPCACFPFRFIQESVCCSCVCRDLETLRLRFPSLSCELSFGFSLHLGVGPRMIKGFTFPWPTFDFLYCLPR